MRKAERRTNLPRGRPLREQLEGVPLGVCDLQDRIALNSNSGLDSQLR